MSFFRKKPEKYKKERTLEDDFVKPRSFDNIDLEDNNQNQVDEIFNQIKKDIELGNDLLNLFDEKCRATHIPVPEELQNIRAAVKRKDNTKPSLAEWAERYGFIYADQRVPTSWFGEYQEKESN